MYNKYRNAIPNWGSIECKDQNNLLSVIYEETELFNFVYISLLEIIDIFRVHILWELFPISHNHLK